MDPNLLRAIPPVDELLESSELLRLREAHPRLPLTPIVRRAVADFRAGRLGTTAPAREQVRAAILRAVQARVGELGRGGMRRLINATGVLLHTNLGRAVMGPAVRDAIVEAATHYTNLEIELDGGTRSHRGGLLEELICVATGAEAAMVVNNNAAAVYLVVSTLSPPARVLISRGELVEIGGSFRLPDILAQAAGEVAEVGTTNRTYARDYGDAMREGDLILRAHRSNYEIHGFTHAPSLGELVDVARAGNGRVVYDLGSGSLFDFGALGIEGEEPVQAILDRGVDAVTMSGDKLLGGVQAGIIVGKRNFLAMLRENPLRRALRVDKITIAALQALMREYLFAPTPVGGVPVLAQAAASVEELSSRARAIIDALDPDVVAAWGVRIDDDAAAVGGGSFACEDVASVAIVVSCPDDVAAEALARSLRRLDVPIISRIKGGEVRLNMRSVLDYDDGDLQRGLAAALSPDATPSTTPESDE